MNTHPVMAIVGNHHYLRQRALREFCAELKQNDFLVSHLSGDSPLSTIREYLSGGLLFGKKVALVVSEPEKMELEFLAQHKDSEAILVLHYEGEPRGNTKFGKFVKSLGTAVKSFTELPQWKQGEEAVRFCIFEASSQGKTIGDKLAHDLVAVVGTDFGVLSFEIGKAAVLASLEGSEVIQTSHVKQTMAPLLEAEMEPLLIGVAARSEGQVNRSLVHIYKTSRADATIRVSRVLGAVITKWLAVALLQEEGVPEEEAAQRMGQNLWFYQNKLFPPSQVWGVKGLKAIVKVLASAERSVFNGDVSPWNVLCSGLLRACRSTSH